MTNRYVAPVDPMIMAVDPSTVSVGVAFGTPLRGIASSHTLALPAKEFDYAKNKKVATTYEQRLNLLVTLLAPLVRKYKPMILALEYPHSNPKNVQSSIKVALATGLVWGSVVMLRSEIAVQLYTPGEWKSGLLGNGNADKVTIAAYVALMGATVNSQDEADARCILEYALSLAKQDMLEME